MGDAKDVATWGQKALKAAPKRKALKPATNPLAGTRYTGKVRQQMRPQLKTGRSDDHGFPLEVDNLADHGRSTPLVGGDGVKRTLVEVDGSYRGKDRHFEWIVEPDQSVNHRLFKAKAQTKATGE